MQLIKKNLRKLLLGLLALTMLVVGLAACTSDGQSHDSAANDSKIQQSNADALQAKRPAHSMKDSGTRKHINDWIDTWGSDPDKPAYVYLVNTEGKVLGFYVMKGLPVSYCTALTPTYTFRDPGGAGDYPNVAVPAPSIDGAYYSGGDCNRYYGFDQTTGAYMEFTVGQSMNMLLYDKPLPNNPNTISGNLAPTK